METEDEIRELKEELRDLQANFDLRWKADMRAINMWQNRTGRTLVWPDHADLCMWLLEELDKSKDEA